LIKGDNECRGECFPLLWERREEREEVSRAVREKECKELRRKKKEERRRKEINKGTDRPGFIEQRDGWQSQKPLLGKEDASSV
jgi:hypothetical protein